MLFLGKFWILVLFKELMFSVYIDE